MSGTGEASCACARYAAPLRVREDVRLRYQVGLTIGQTLERVGDAKDRQFVLHRCRACGQFWQESKDEMWYRACYQVPPVALEEWRERPYPDQAMIAIWRSALDTAGPEVGPELCREPGCRRLRARLSVFCAKHHLIRNCRTMLPESALMPEEYRD